MATKTGTGLSKRSDAAQAAEEALNQAMAGLGGTPDLVIAFASTIYNLPTLAKALKKKAGTANVVGCTTAGEFTEQQAGSNSLTVMVVKSDSIKFELVKTTNVKGNHVQALDPLFVDHEAKLREMSAKGFKNATILMLTDGLMGRGEELVQAVYDRAGILCQIVGGAAGDDGKFKGTSLIYGEEVLSNAAVFVRVYSQGKVGIGVQHGMRSCTKPMIVTKAIGSVVHEIDNKPAFEVYKDYAKKKGIDLVAADAGKFLINNELAIAAGFFTKVRAPLAANLDGSLSMATEVPQGSTVTIVDSDSGELLKAAKGAAEEAKKNLGGAKAAGVLVFDCICRKTILADDFMEEVNAIKGVFDGKPPILGFATYGEIARFGGKFNGFHNSTAVICALPD